ncbi:hypothetical protein [Acinetobacter ursingii]|uniref:hypothetical protein n=1 Tax=Acinetobacter ursingii TaxID=108980 RepID=UPI0021CDAC83|nr:hypothetical protein [Acinetobacter ursingii]MCU4481365.1 hypothetical protein [Acinetobacter ursingii]MCU4505697.1 hypothetical protein [Acinetobacter ursingii]MCU4569643.1 hypothetical protein [Acinetobacter ursingii]
MDASGLFTVLGIFIAIITLISEEKRQDFFLRASIKYWIFFIILNFIALSLIYSGVITAVLQIEPFDYLLGFDEKTAVLTCVILMGFLFNYKLFGKKLPSSQYDKWVDVSYSLLRIKKYHVLSYLLEKYLEQFLNIINKRTRYENFIGYIYKNSRLSANEFLQFPPIQVGKGRELKFYILNKIYTILPKEIGYKSKIYKSIERLLKSSSFLDYLIETHPVVPVKLTSSPLILRIDEFTDNFFKGLIANKNSQLYRELKDNQHFMYSTGYRIEPENFILDYYFSDPENAIRANIWKPVGDYLCDFIKQQKGNNRFYNSYSESYIYTDEPWKCPIFVGIQFFDVMVKSAIYKKIDDHMWLMYYKYFLDEILKNLDRTENSEIWQEFPLKFDYLIYNLISNCSDWIDAANYLYDDDVKSIVAIESASECLGTMINKLLLSDKFDGNKKAYYLEIILKLMKGLDSKGNVKLSQKIYSSMIGATMFSSVDSDLTWLKNIYRDVDHVLRLSGSTFDTEIKKAP